MNNEVYCTISDLVASMISAPRSGPSVCKDICIARACIRECSPVWLQEKSEEALNAVLQAMLQAAERAIVEIDDAINVVADTDVDVQYLYLIGYFVARAKNLLEKTIYVGGNNVICKS